MASPLLPDYDRKQMAGLCRRLIVMSISLRSGFYIAATVLTLGASPALAQSGGPPAEQPKPAETRRPPAPQPAERPTLNRRPPQPEAPKPAPAPAPKPAPQEQSINLPPEIIAVVDLG